jgi:hypothetical protein
MQNLKERESLGDVSIGRRIILKRISKKQGIGVLPGFI